MQGQPSVSCHTPAQRGPWHIHGACLGRQGWVLAGTPRDAVTTHPPLRGGFPMRLDSVSPEAWGSGLSGMPYSAPPANFPFPLILIVKYFKHTKKYIK